MIASDLIYNGAHPWLAEHRTSSWLRQLDDVEKRFGNIPTIYAGHGQPGTPALFAEQRSYIENFRGLIGKNAGSSTIPNAVMETIMAETTRGRDGWPLDSLIPMNAGAVAEELSLETRAL